MTAKSPTPATAQDLIDATMEQLRALKDGEITPAQMNAHVNGTASVLRVVKMQMEYAKAINKTPSIPLLLTVSKAE